MFAYRNRKHRIFRRHDGKGKIIFLSKHARQLSPTMVA
jgi:hypothetical protein